MRIAFAFLLAAAAGSFPAHAAGDTVQFEGVQEHCVQAGSVKFGLNSRWSNCRVTKGRWFATLGIIDMYQAQYCLGKDDEVCDRRALLVFANRAYTPKAQVILQRTDPGATEYDDPLVVDSPDGDLLQLTGRMPDGQESKSYYLWKSGRWVPIEARGWLRDLSKRLPKGTSVAGDVWPDADSMHAQVKLNRNDGAAGEVADVELSVSNGRFIVKKVSFAARGA
jgi:hypothetical protein